ncbi:NADH dehydrogenase [ubiquinone] 1 beta subcomplex subunit 7-like [Olea europaea var. sylvestris]|uniref:NADH dehydrogenase [ubiquinone] 1 beta subcomplex subunit 7-like n=1 Tax=Olea europaea var. sylvestris TaxID=158386 RepID=UPI000C1D317D|nr:NADH dehydrogenase [ubiquinone] 1 beta subcomplex subunit 7-like [Olea europaea var. sylvestris]
MDRFQPYPARCRRIGPNIYSSRRIEEEREVNFTQNRRFNQSFNPMEVPGSSKKMIATREEMVVAKVPIPYRDQCAHLLIPLNMCRQAEFYLPWKCEAERHTYEKCEYELVMERMLQMQKIREQEAKVKGSHRGQLPIPLIPKTADA